MNENTITKPANVIMLHSNEPSMLWTTSMGILMKTLNNSNIKSLTNKHLYFTTEDIIEEGDWCVDVIRNIIIQCQKFKEKSIAAILGKSNYLDKEQANNGYSNSRGKIFRKIVATTNPEIWSKKAIKGIPGHFINNPLPKIDISFVEAYVREQGKINQVLLEYEHPTKGYFAGIELYDSMIEILKLKSNGSVIVHRVKDKIYTKDEVETLLHALYSDCTTQESYDGYYFDNWVKHNLL